MVRLGLDRISLLVRDIKFPWRAIHVAGTNGKGSVCAYIAAMLHHSHLRTGRFTSPHLIDRWDCIAVAERTVSKSIFDEAEEVVKQRNAERSIGASEFELLTATAFEIFAKENVDVAIVECGMGGRLDATNVIEEPLATVITQIGLDHQAFLGDTLTKIAAEKAGIIKPGADCFVLGTNSPEVIATITEVARTQQVQVITVPSHYDQKAAEVFMEGGILSYDDHLRYNMNLAWAVVQGLKSRLALMDPGSIFGSDSPNDIDKALIHILSRVEIPGRSQDVDLRALTGRSQAVFCDGGHNSLGFEALRESIRKRRWRGSDGNGAITWLVAVTSGRNPEDLANCIENQDSVVVTQFGPVDGMPWVEPTPAAVVADTLSVKETYVEPDPLSALLRAVKIANDGPLVITGSLYLLSDIFRLNRDKASG